MTIRILRSLPPFFLPSLFVLAGCSTNSGGGSAPAGRSGLDESKASGSLTNSELATLCDWVASIGGGYGKKTDCGGGVVLSSSASQAECIKDKPPPSCKATVKQTEDCLLAVEKDLCAVATGKSPTPAVCAPLMACSPTTGDAGTD